MAIGEQNVEFPQTAEIANQKAAVLQAGTNHARVGGVQKGDDGR